MDSLSALNTFVQAAEARNFTEAGRVLGLSSSAIGKAIARLEADLGVRLFHRSTRSIALTPEGHVLLNSSRRILLEMGEMERELSDANSAPRGKLRVALPLLGHLFAPAFSSFMVAYPNIELDLDFSDRIVDIVSDGFDVAIRTGEGVDSRLLSRRIGVYTMTLVASPNYLAERGMPASPSDLIGHACVHHRYSTTGKLERWPLRADDGADVIVPVTASISSVAPLLDMAESGCGIACLPDFIVKRGVREGRLIRLLDAYLEHENVFRVVWPSSRYIAPRLRVFIDHMADHVFPRQIGSTSTARRSS